MSSKTSNTDRPPMGSAGKMTPGPWRVGCDYCHEPLDVLGEAHVHIARIKVQSWKAGDLEATANARAIACLPELIEAAGWVLGLADGSIMVAKGGTKKALEHLRSILARIDGEEA